MVFEHVTKEYEFKINLSRQIDRINELMSQMIESNENPSEAFKRLVNAKLNAVDALEAMLKFYWNDEEDEKAERYRKNIEALIVKSRPKFKDTNDYNVVEAKENYAEQKYGIIMGFIGEKGWLIEEGAIAEERGEDENVA